MCYSKEMYIIYLFLFWNFGLEIDWPHGLHNIRYLYFYFALVYIIPPFLLF
jgi:hypothetical protein